MIEWPAGVCTASMPASHRGPPPRSLRFAQATRAFAGFAMPGLWVEGSVSEEHGLKAWSTQASVEMPRRPAPGAEQAGEFALPSERPCLGRFPTNTLDSSLLPTD